MSLPAAPLASHYPFGSWLCLVTGTSFSTLKCRNIPAWKCPSPAHIHALHVVINKRSLPLRVDKAEASQFYWRCSVERLVNLLVLYLHADHAQLDNKTQTSSSSLLLSCGGFFLAFFNLLLPLCCFAIILTILQLLWTIVQRARLFFKSTSTSNISHTIQLQ